MKTIFIPLLLSFFICTADLFGQDQANAPKYKDGDFWVYRSKIGGTNPLRSSNDPNGDYELTYSNGKLDATKIDGEQKNPTSDNLAVIRAMFASENFTQYLQFPLSAGKKWNFDYKLPISGRDVAVRSQVEVTKLEDITTPAGTFRAFKIERLDTATQLRIDRVYYYSPQTGSIVKFRWESTAGRVHDVELIKFGPAR